MGKSFTTFKGSGFWCRDGLLEVWLRCVALHFPDDAYQSDTWLHELRDQWMFASSGLCNGWVTAALDEHVTDSTRAEIVVAASKRAISRLRAFSEIVPSAFLNALGIEGTSFNDHPIEWYEEIHDTFTSLLEGRLLSDAASSSVLPSSQQATPASEQPRANKTLDTNT